MKAIIVCLLLVLLTIPSHAQSTTDLQAASDKAALCYVLTEMRSLYNPELKIYLPSIHLNYHNAASKLVLRAYATKGQPDIDSCKISNTASLMFNSETARQRHNILDETMRQGLKLKDIHEVIDNLYADKGCYSLTELVNIE